MLDVQVSGTKAQVVEGVTDQVKNIALSRALRDIVSQAPGTHLSLSGTLTSDPTKKFGTMSMVGSFWTPSA